MLKDSESGVSPIVEATLLMPFIILTVLALYYAALFITVRANLQANLENALIYCKNQESDTFVSVLDDVAFGDKITASEFHIPNAPMNPYRFIFTKFKPEEYKRIFSSFLGYLFFEDASEATMEAKMDNYVIYKRITGAAQRTVHPAVNLKLIGATNTLKLTASASIIVTDGDEFIRTVDLVHDLLIDTEVGKAGLDLIDKVAELYGKFKDALGI
ncbi:MAG: hypothetical protein K6G16_10905 [Lachnospiraceae bacterium]|nr:hypothetical protein [Lachnospiraceae bacterium]